MDNNYKYWKSISELFSIKYSQEDVRQFEEALVTEPNNVELRAKLCGYYTSLDPWHPKTQEHGLWFMEKYPAAEAGLFYIFIPAFDWQSCESSYLMAEKLWLDHVANYPNNPVVLNNACLFLQLNPGMEHELRRRIFELESTDVNAISSYFECCVQKVSTVASATRASCAKEVLHFFKEHETLLRQNYTSRKLPPPIVEAARCALMASDFAEAERLAREVLSIKKWPFKDSTAKAHQEAYDILGLAALEQNDIQLAKSFLKLSGNIRYLKNQLPWMYPEKRLAQALIDRGEVESVCEYLENYPLSVHDNGKTCEQTVQKIAAGKPIFLCNGELHAMHRAIEGIYLCEHGEKQRAEQALLEARQMLIEEAKTYYFVGVLEAALNRLEEAFQTLSRCFSLDPSLRAKSAEKKTLDVLREHPIYGKIF